MFALRHRQSNSNNVESAGQSKQESVSQQDACCNKPYPLVWCGSLDVSQTSVSKPAIWVRVRSLCKVSIDLMYANVDSFLDPTVSYVLEHPIHSLL